MMIDGKLEYAWLYILAPLLGAVIGAACMWVIHRKDDPKTLETVQGHPSHTSNI